MLDSPEPDDDLYDLVRQLRDNGYPGQIQIEGPDERNIVVRLTTSAHGPRKARRLLARELANLTDHSGS